MLKEKEKEKKEPEVSEIDAVSEFSKHFKRVMKEREKEEETKKEPISVTPVKEEEKKEEMEEEEEEEEEKEEEEGQNISVGLGGILSMLRSQNAQDLEEEAYGRRTDRVIRDEANDGGSENLV